MGNQQRRAIWIEPAGHLLESIHDAAVELPHTFSPAEADIITPANRGQSIGVLSLNLLAALSLPESNIELSPFGKGLHLEPKVVGGVGRSSKIRRENQIVRTAAQTLRQCLGLVTSGWAKRGITLPLPQSGGIAFRFAMTDDSYLHTSILPSPGSNSIHGRGCVSPKGPEKLSDPH